jgi:hypothetical protein
MSQKREPGRVTVGGEQQYSRRTPKNCWRWENLLDTFRPEHMEWNIEEVSEAY